MRGRAVHTDLQSLYIPIRDLVFTIYPEGFISALTGRWMVAGANSLSRTQAEIMAVRCFCDDVRDDKIFNAEGVAAL